MKVVLLFLCVAIVAAFAADIDMDFVKQAMAFKEELSKRDAEEAMEMARRAMVQLPGIKCSAIGDSCGIFKPCCHNNINKCSRFLGGECIPR